MPRGSQISYPQISGHLFFILFCLIWIPNAMSGTTGLERLHVISEHSREKTRLELITEYLELARTHPVIGVGDEAIYRAACLLDTVTMELSGKDACEIGETIQTIRSLLGEPVASTLDVGHYGGVETTDALYSMLDKTYPQSVHAPEVGYKLLLRNIQSCNPFDEIDAVQSYLGRFPLTSHRTYLIYRLALRMDDVWEGLTLSEEYDDVPDDRMDSEEAWRKALDYYKQVIKLGPETNEAKQSRDRLKSLGKKQPDRQFYGDCGC